MAHNSTLPLFIVLSEYKASFPVALPTNIQFHMSELVEEKSSAVEKDDGWDIADYILKI